MSDDRLPMMKDFESWLLHRVAQAVEAAEVSAELLAELQAEFAALERPAKDSEAAAIQHIADLAAVPEVEARSVLQIIEAQPAVTRELLLR